MNKQEIYNAAKHGWSTLEFTTDVYYRNKRGKSSSPETATCACFIGAAAHGAGLTVTQMQAHIIAAAGINSLNHIIWLNDRSAGKKASLKKVADFLQIPEDMR